MKRGDWLPDGTNAADVQRRRDIFVEVRAGALPLATAPCHKRQESPRQSTKTGAALQGGYAASTSMARGCAEARLATLMVTTPSFAVARTALGSASAGSRKLRVNLP